MSANTGSGGVRNLRAMFENKGGDTTNSPPSRGRSPSGSIASSSSRPVSKVRASFVAVERSGEQGQLWGLRKASDVSSMAEVAKENETSVVDGPPLAATKSTPERNPSGGLGSILKGSSFTGTPMKQESNKTGPIQEKVKSPVTATSTGDQHKQPSSNGVGARAAAAAKRTQEKAKTSVAKSNPKPIETKAAPTNADKKSPRTPTSAGIKPRGGVAKIQGVMDSAKKAAEGREATKKASTTTSAKSPTVPKSPAKANGTKETVRSPRTTAAPKSPAKPAKLPSAATAPTAASAAHTRTTAEAPTKKTVHSDRPAKLPSAVTATTAASAAHDRSALEPQPTKPVSRRLSAVHPTSSRLSTTGTQASLAKKASRASLADRPKSRASINKPDESFLSRMMRPTQSSAQKTHEKSQVSSPPRARAAAPKPKAVSRPSLNGRAHHDHADEKGDYATKSPTSPTATKQFQKASHKSTTPSKPATEQHQVPGTARTEEMPAQIHADANSDALQLTAEPSVPAQREPAIEPSSEPSQTAPAKAETQSTVSNTTKEPEATEALELTPAKIADDEKEDDLRSTNVAESSTTPSKALKSDPPSTTTDTQPAEKTTDSKVQPPELGEKAADSSIDKPIDVSDKPGLEAETATETAAV